ncbi:MAG: DUF4258 domain-containing protein [bacterium]
MPGRVLDKIRARVRSRQYVMTLHAEEEMEEDGVAIFDVEIALLSGRVVGRQIDDHESGNTSSGGKALMTPGSSLSW